MTKTEKELEDELAEGSNKKGKNSCSQESGRYNGCYLVTDNRKKT